MDDKWRYTGMSYAIQEPIKYTYHTPTLEQIKGNGNCWFIHKWEDYFWAAQLCENLGTSLGFNLEKCTKCGKVKGIEDAQGSFIRAACG